MIKLIFRLFVLGYFVLGFSLKIHAEETEDLRSSVSQIESYQQNIDYSLSDVNYRLEDILTALYDHTLDYGYDFFNVYSYQLQQIIDGSSRVYTHDDQLYDQFMTFYDDYVWWNMQHGNVLDHLSDVPQINEAIRDNISTIQSELLPFFSSFTFDNSDLNVYDQRVAGLIKELKEQSGSNDDRQHEQIGSLGESIANGFKELGDTFRDGLSSGPNLDFLTQPQLEETYDKFLIPNFYQSFHESKAIPFANYISWSDPTSMDYKQESSFDIKEQAAEQNSDGDFFQVLSGYLSNLASLHANNSRSLILMTKIMKGEDHKQEEEDLKNDINENLGRDQEIHQAMDELITILQDSYTTKKSSEFFDLSSLEDIAHVSLPNEINLGTFPMSNIFGIDLTEFKRNSFTFDITFFHPMIEVSRSAFSILLYLFLGSIAIFIYRLSAPFIFRIIDLLKSSFSNW